MAEVIVGPLLSKVQEVVVKEAKALAAVGGEIDKLRDKLMWLQALVHEAELRGRHDGSRLIRVLAFQIRDASFEVEDAVDQYYLQGSLSRRFGCNWWRIAKELIFNLRTHVCVRAILSRRIRSVNVRLEEIVGNNSTIYIFWCV
ncbi:putative disease resistance protein At1g50180 isoform X2 [Miscanthus floridulus]|uniref:putative disease resistance protein At1g50180 isoform X2 n=1 Tax=Miscanthus floridulus TaxID=154761 RepID=UPI0034584275